MNWFQIIVCKIFFRVLEKRGFKIIDKTGSGIKTPKDVFRKIDPKDVNVRIED